MAHILKAQPVDEAIHAETFKRKKILDDMGVVPTLAIVRVGVNPDDLAYERGARARCEAVGVRVEVIELPTDVTQMQLGLRIGEINTNKDIHGCLLLRPLPPSFDEESLSNMLTPEKDVDGMTYLSLCAIFTGKGFGFPPCTAQAVVEVLKHYEINLDGAHAVVLGRSLVVGRPVASLLQQQNATVTMCHSHTKNVEILSQQADILIAAMGKARIVGPEYTHEDQVVIDVGINFTPEGSLVGDVDFQAVESQVSAISPVPGGVGGITTAVLAKHVVEAAIAQNSIS